MLPIALLFVALALPASTSAATGCASVSANSKTYDLFTQRVPCAFAKQAARKLIRSKGTKRPKGYICTSGSNWKSDGQCTKKGAPEIIFGFGR